MERGTGKREEDHGHDSDLGRIESVGDLAGHSEGMISLSGSVDRNENMFEHGVGFETDISMINRMSTGFDLMMWPSPTPPGESTPSLYDLERSERNPCTRRGTLYLTLATTRPL